MALQWLYILEIITSVGQTSGKVQGDKGIKHRNDIYIKGRKKLGKRREN